MITCVDSSIKSFEQLDKEERSKRSLHNHICVCANSEKWGFSVFFKEKPIFRHVYIKKLCKLTSKYTNFLFLSLFLFLFYYSYYYILYVIRHQAIKLTSKYTELPC